MSTAMLRMRRSTGVAALLAACGIAMLAALYAVYASLSLSPDSWVHSVPKRENAAAQIAEPEAFKFREGIAADEAAAINKAIPDSDQPIVPARSLAILTPQAATPSQLSAVDCLTATVYYEAASESLTGQRAVAQVVLNRVRHPAYPNSVCGVVFQGSQRKTGCQFTFTCDGATRRRPSASGWARARAVATAALSGYVEPSVGLATHYHTTYVVPYWSSSLTKLRTVGSHIFYRWSGSTGTRGAFVSGYSGAEAIPASAVANLSGYLFAASSAVPIDLTSADAAITPAAVIAPPSSGLIAQSGGRLGAGRSMIIEEKSGDLTVSASKLKSDDTQHRLIDERPRLLD